MFNQHHAFTLKPVYEKSLQRYADRTAARFQDTTMSYRELDQQSNALANSLADLGVDPEDRVALLMENCMEYVVTDVALIKVGAAKLPLNSMLTQGDIEYMLSDAGATTVVCGPNFVDDISTLHNSLDVLENTIAIADAVDASVPAGFERFEALVEKGVNEKPPSADPRPDAIAGHYYTGGTTGKPKGVVHTQKSRTMNIYAHIMELDITGNDDLLLSTPLPHAAAAFLRGALLIGATTHIHEDFDIPRTLRDIETYDITWTFMAPTMIYRLLDHPDLEEYDTSSLRSLVYGAAPITPNRLKEGLDAFGAVFQQFYGQTEVPNLITTFGKDEHEVALERGNDERLSSAGQPVLMIDVKIVDPQTDTEVENGESGEIFARGPYTMESYYERPEANGETFVDSWVRTGDIGKIDEEGYVYLLDRKSDLIISGGMNVYSAEVEDVLDQHPKIRMVAVIGIPDDDWGEAVHAVVVPEDESVTEKEIISFGGDYLTDYKKPKQVEFVSEIPTTPYGKMDKKALRKPYWEGKERQIG